MRIRCNQESAMSTMRRKFDDQLGPAIRNFSMLRCVNNICGLDGESDPDSGWSRGFRLPTLVIITNRPKSRKSRSDHACECMSMKWISLMKSRRPCFRLWSPPNKKRILTQKPSGTLGNIFLQEAAAYAVDQPERTRNGKLLGEF